VENATGLIAAAMVTEADGFAERDAALLMLPSDRKIVRDALRWAPTRHSIRRFL